MAEQEIKTLACEKDVHAEFNEIADANGILLRHSPRLLLAGWKLLTPDQVAKAHEVYRFQMAGNAESAA